MTLVQVQFVLIFAQPTQCSSVCCLRLLNDHRRQPFTEPKPMSLPLKSPTLVWTRNASKPREVLNFHKIASYFFLLNLPFRNLVDSLMKILFILKVFIFTYINSTENIPTKVCRVQIVSLVVDFQVAYTTLVAFVCLQKMLTVQKQ